MRFILEVTIPHDTFNAAVKDGSAGTKMKKILDELKPEAVYFTDNNGRRSGLLIVDLADASRLPSYTEPWFLAFNADIRVRLAMTPEDLGKAGLDELGRKWA